MRRNQRALITEGIAKRTGIDDAMIERLVRSFYDRVRTDTLLGPVFCERISDWESHLKNMIDFWSSVALTTGRYHGQAMEKHLPLPIDAWHFDRWLELFEDTARATCPTPAAEHFIEKAERIAESLELGIAIHCGVQMPKGHRFVRTGTELPRRRMVGNKARLDE